MKAADDNKYEMPGEYEFTGKPVPAPASTGREPDVIPVRLPSGGKAIVQVPGKFTIADGVHLMNFLTEYLDERVEGAPVAARELDVEAERRAAVMQVFDDAAAALHEEINQASVREAEDGDDEGQKNFLAGKMAGIVAVRVAFRRALSASKPEAAPVSTEQAGDAPRPELQALYPQALDLVHEAGYASVSMVQRRLRIGWNAARDLIVLMHSRSEIPDAWLPPAAWSSLPSPVGGKGEQ